MNYQKIIISLDAFTTYSPVTFVCDPKRLFPYFIQAQSCLNEIVGEDLVDYYVEKVNSDGFVPTDVDTAFLNAIAPYVSNMTCWFALPFLSFQFSQKGITKESSENSTTISTSEIAFLRDALRNQADNLKHHLITFMNENASDYPLYRKPSPKTVERFNFHIG